MKIKPKDLPRDELMELAETTIRQYAARGIAAHVQFKFTCVHCGERCMLQDSNRLYEIGICSKCEKETKIEKGGFMLVLDYEKEGS